MKKKLIETKITARRVVVFTVSLFALVLAAGGAIFMLSMRQIIRDNKSGELVRTLDNERVKIEAQMGLRVSAVLRMADSPVIRRYLADPDNDALKKTAFEEIDGYRRSLVGNSVFWVSGVNRKFYSDGEYEYDVDPEDGVDFWYNMTMRETNEFNVGIIRVSGGARADMRINAPVFDVSDRRKPVGVLGVGMDAAEFVNEIYGNYGGNAEFYIFNNMNEIVAARDAEIVISKRSANEVFGDVAANIAAMTLALAPGYTQTFSTPIGEVGLCMIPAFGWYAVAISPNTAHDYKNSMTWLFLYMIAAIALMLVMFNIFIAQLFKPLRDTMNSLEDALKVKDEFLAKMSHEIRTPMNAVTGMAELALREEMSPAAREYIFTIRQAGANLLSIINDILDLAKIKSGKMELVPVDYSLESMIGDVANIIKVRVMKSPVQFLVHLNSKIPSVLHGDELRIKQILLNVLTNAVKYTQEGSVSLLVDGKIVDDDSVILTMDVIDTGKGIREEDMEKLFRSFEQIGGGINRGVEGTGLGLSITKNLVSAMGGEISVESVYGKGSKFTITLPQKIRSCEPVAIANGRYGVTAPLFSAPEARVLVVDDVKTNLEVAKGLLSLYDMKIDTCRSGAEAINMAMANMYDIIFMDQMMPEMDGVEATSRIRALGVEHPYFYDLPIVALTANAVVGTRETLLQNGFNDYLPKPVDTADLGIVLKKWIPREKQMEHCGRNQPSFNEAGGGDIYVSGVDVKTGIARTGGSVEAYLRVLEVFYGDGNEKVGRIRKCLEANDLQLYTTLVHALKSATANIGALELSQSIHELEMAGRRSDRKYIDDNTNNTLAALEVLLSGINKVLLGRKADKPSEVDMKTFGAALEKLKAAIGDIDPAAITGAVKLLRPFEGAPDVGGKVADILRDVLNGNYDGAVSRIEALLQELSK